MDYFTVYRITNIINNKIYIGVHKTEDLNDSYTGSGKYLKRAIKKYGEDNFTKEILFIFDNVDDMLYKEAELVDEDFIKNDSNYNLKVGGEGGFDYINLNKINIYPTHSERSRENLDKGHAALKKLRLDESYRIKNGKAISKALKNKYKTADHHWKGRKHTDETKNKIGRINSINQKGSGNSQYGTCWIYSEGLKINKKIDKDNLQEWINSGWIKGRKMFQSG